MRIFLANNYKRSAVEGLDGIGLKVGIAESEEEVYLALHLAEKSFTSKSNIARKKKFEFLLWLSGTRDIKNALKRTEPEEGSEFILVLLSGEPPKELSTREVKLKKEGEALRLEKISLSRIS